jgi:hypothetical protein
VNTFLLVTQLLLLVRYAFSIIIGIGLSFFWVNFDANASEQLILSYGDARLTAPYADIEAFTLNDQSTEALDTFFQNVPIASETVHDLLAAETLVNQEKLSRSTVDFVLIQLDKFLGDANGRERSDAMRTAFTSAYQDDQTLSILELIEEYPESTIWVDLRRMEKTYTDIKTFVEKIQPLLFVSDELLADLVCECSITPGWLEPNLSQSSSHNTDYDTGCEVSRVIPVAVEEAIAPPVSLQSATSIKSTEDRSDRFTKRLVFTFGPVRPSFSIDELTRFAETGTVPRALALYLRLANLKPKVLRSVLTREISVDLEFLDRNLNSLLGEYALFQIGQIIHTPSHQANIQALRAGLVLSARDDNRFSLIEFLQNYPLQQVYVDGVKLARIATDVGKVARGITKGDTRRLEDFLIDVRSSIAKDVCNCGATS